jgi:putative endonuclease
MSASFPAPSAPAHLLLGRSGEDIAAAYLSAHGYELRARNVRLDRDEIDLVAYDTREKMLVFVEVKTRRRYSAAYPIRTAVTLRKRRALRRAVAAWVAREEYAGPARIDLVCVCGGRVREHLMDLGSEFLVDV